MGDNRPRVAQSATPTMIRDRKGFVASSLTARVVDGMGFWDNGKLAGEDADQFRLDSPHIDYVVWSYVTPIAWHVTDTDGGEHWHVVKQRFSTTTSTKHQSRLYLIGT